MSAKKGKLVGEDVREAFNNNLDEMIDSVTGHLDFEEMERIASTDIS